MQALSEFVRAPEMRLFYWTIAALFGIYVWVWLVSRVVLYLRNALHRTTPYIDHIVHVTTLSGCLLAFLLPAYALIRIGVESYHLRSYYYLLFLIPYLVVGLALVLVMIKLAKKHRPEPVEEED